MYTASTGPETSLRPPASFGSVAVTVDGTPLQTVPLVGRVLTVGRLPENDLVLPDPTVSRYHAEIRVENGGAAVTDLGSSGGTAVGGVRASAHQPVALPPGTVVRIGPYALEYVAPPPAPFAPPADGRGDGRGDGARGDDILAALAVPARVPVDSPVVVRAVDPARPLANTLAARDEPLPVVPARPTWPAERPPVGQSRYLRDLPAVFQENDFLGRMLQIYETIWEPLERRQDHIALYFSPRTCPSAFLPWLAGWLHLTLNRHWPEERRRLLLSEAMELYRWRGTAYGLTRMIEVCTGLTPTITEDGPGSFVFRVALRLPPGSEVRREVVEEIVRQHKPAHVGYVLEVG